MHERRARRIRRFLLHDRAAHAIAAIGKGFDHLVEGRINLHGTLIAQTLVGKARQLTHLGLQRHAGCTQAPGEHAHHDSNNRGDHEHTQRQFPADRCHEHQRDDKFERILNQRGQRLTGNRPDLLRIVGDFRRQFRRCITIKEAHWQAEKMGKGRLTQVEHHPARHPMQRQITQKIGDTAQRKNRNQQQRKPKNRKRIQCIRQRREKRLGERARCQRMGDRRRRSGSAFGYKRSIQNARKRN